MMGGELGQSEQSPSRAASLYKNQKCQDDSEEESHAANVSWQAGGEADVVSQSKSRTDQELRSGQRASI